MRHEVHSGRLKLNGNEDDRTLRAANNYADSLVNLERFEEVRSLMRKTIPVARRVLGDNDRLTLKLRCNYAQSLYLDANATLDDVREAVTTLEEIARTTRRVLGGSNPLTPAFEFRLQASRLVLRARETPPSSA